MHRARNLIAKLPDQERERVRRAYWKALDEAKDERDGTERLAALVAELERAGYASAARCLADDLDALVVHLRYPLRHRKRWRSTNLLERTLGEGGCFAKVRASVSAGVRGGFRAVAAGVVLAAVRRMGPIGRSRDPFRPLRPLSGGCAASADYGWR